MKNLCKTREVSHVFTATFNLSTIFILYKFYITHIKADAAGNHVNAIVFHVVVSYGKTIFVPAICASQEVGCIIGSRI